MVIDWRKQIDECIRFTKVIPTFHASALEKTYQQILITKKLLDMNYNAEMILNWFLLAEENCDKDIADIEALIKASKKRRWPKKHDFKIYVTLKEVEYIQKMKASKECKSYLLATVAYCKLMKIRKKVATFNKRERSYVYFLATGKDNYNIGTRRGPYIQQFIKTLEKNKQLKLEVKDTKVKKYGKNCGGSYIKIISDVIMNAKWIDWDSTDGYEITDIESQMKMLCDQCFENDMLICPICHNEFYKGNQTKRLLCEECYKERRKEQKRNFARSYYGCAPRANKWSEKDDELLRSIYSEYGDKKIKQILLGSFPNRELKAIYNRASYLKLKKNKKSEI